MSGYSAVAIAAPILRNQLCGILNIYKPAGVTVPCVRSSILGNLCKALNECNRELINISHTESSESAVKVLDNLPAHVCLPSDPHFHIDDFKFIVNKHLGRETSGVLLAGINNGTKIIHQIRQLNLPRVYHITGKFGIATEDHFQNSRVIARATYRHIWMEKLNALLSSMQASNQKKIFELTGVDLQSQTAYELAVRGLMQPDNKEIPFLYAIKCIEFHRPEFTIAVNVINENEFYLAELIHEIGLQMHSVAHCVQVRCVQDGNFFVKDSLLRHQWTMPNIIGNMQLWREVKGYEK